MLKILHKTLLTILFAAFASQASAMFIQPDWFDPTAPGVGTNRYSYSANDPINNLDTNGNWYDGYYGVYPTMSYNTDPNANQVLRAIENTGIYVINTPTSLMNIVADGVYGLGEVAAPYSGPIENMAVTTPTAADDIVASAFRGWTRLSVSLGSRASKPADAISIAYQQTKYSEKFSPQGAQIFIDKVGSPINTIDDLAGAIRSGKISASEIPVNYVVRDGTRVVANTRTSVALQRAGIDPSDWKWVDQTGDADWEKRVDNALRNNKLDNL